MIESFMYFAIGFLLAALGVLVVAPLIHGRAVRLTMHRLEASIPLTLAEVQADKDLLRAEFAMSARRLEKDVDRLRDKNASLLAELGRKGDAINRFTIELSALRDRLRVAEEFAEKNAAGHEGGHALSDKEAELAKQMSELAEWSTLADAQKVEIIALKTQVETLKIQLSGSGDELKMLHDRSNAAVREARLALSQKESELAQLLRELNAHSNIANAQKSEIIKLNAQIESLKQQLAGISDELRAVQDCRESERIELKAATHKLIEERTKFKKFHQRVGELVQQLIAQSIQDKTVKCRAEELESRLIEQSRRLKESELKVIDLRAEIDAARKAEAELPREIEARINSAVESLKAEKAKLQAAFDRANGERARLGYELANIKRRVDRVGAAERESSLVSSS